jgi:two-component system chemotaxis response regulator CheB
MAGHDIIVVGASAGGVEALLKLVVQFPDNLSATVFVAQHVSATARGMLAQILDRAGPLPAMLAQDGEVFKQAHIYIAPPDHHLLLKEGCLQVTRGLRENRVRPAIDPLFRSAAVTYGARVVGIILSGLQDDGAAGLLAVKRCGGVAMVQAPSDALFPEMPQNALRHVQADHCLPVSKMGAVLYQLTQEAIAEIPPIPRDIVAEVQIAESPREAINRDEELGTLAPVTCPECGGPLWELHNDSLQRYRCRLGHAFTATNLLEGQSEAIETALWTAVRTMEERAHILTQLAHGRQEHGQGKLAERYATQAEELITYAKHLRQILLNSL